jgi:chemotaxis protein CheX
MHETVEEVVKFIWDAVLGEPIEVEDDDGGATSSQRSLMACVQVSGAWNGFVAAKFAPQAARQIAEIMLCAEGPNDDDVNDAIAEITNMIGGNLKGLLPPPCQLSPPWVTSSTEGKSRVPNCRTVGQVAFRWRETPLEVTVLAADGARL